MKPQGRGVEKNTHAERVKCEESCLQTKLGGKIRTCIRATEPLCTSSVTYFYNMMRFLTGVNCHCVKNLINKQTNK